MEEQKAGRFSSETFIQQLWNERFSFPIPEPEHFIPKWSDVPSMFVISAFNDARTFLKRLPDKNAMDIAKLITSTISRSLVIQEGKRRKAAQ
jgi:hypothetical protein